MHHRVWLLSLALVLVALLAPLLVSQTASATSTTGTVRIVFPLNNGVVSTAGTRLQFVLTDFTLDPGGAACLVTSNSGFIRVYVDDVAAMDVYDTNATLPSIGAGTTKIGAQLICTDGTPFDPQIWSNITVTTGEPEIDLLEPGSPVVFSTLGGRVDYRVSNFTFSPGFYGGPHIPGEGHVHLFVGTSLVGTSVYPYADISAFPVGAFTLKVELHNNDHTLVRTAAHPDGINVTAQAIGVAPSIAILSPSNAGTVSSRGFRVSASVLGLELDAEHYAGTNIPGHGHIHYLVDGALASATASTYADIGALSLGAHTIRAELRNNDHSALSPAVFDEATATVADPSITIVSPADGAQVSTSGFGLQTAVGGFDLSQDTYAGTAVPGQGHIHYLVDGALAQPTAQTFYDFSGLTPGDHLIRAELRNNDHSALSPAVFAEITVTASGPAIEIRAPTDMGSVSTLGARVTANVLGLVLDDANYAGPNIAGHGHIHYSVDGSLASATTSTFADLGPFTAGTHVIRTELRNNDHSALSPAVFDEILVTAVAPSIAIVEPATSGTGTGVSTLGFRIVVSPAGLELDRENYAGANILGHGHIHYYVGTSLLGATTSTVFDIGPLATGTHTVRAELRNNDHSALSPAVFDEITVVAGPPEIRILEPLGASAASTLGFRMRFAVSNFTLDPMNYAGSPIPGRGHIHVLRMPAATLLATPTSDHVLITGLTAGSTIVRAELRNNDHSVLNPAVFAEVTVTVTAPSITLAVPASIAEGDPLDLTWSVTGFVLDAPAFGGPPEPGRGHVHVFVDGTYVAAVAATSFRITDLAVGTHTLDVQLFHNDHTALASLVASSGTVVVAAPTQPPTTNPAPLDATGFYGLTGGLLAVVVALAVLLVRKGRRPPRGSGREPPET